MNSHDASQLTTVLMSRYGLTVRQFRKSRNMSQMDLEIKTGLNFGVISRIEKSKINPTKETLFKIAIALNLNNAEIWELFGMDSLHDSK